MASLAPAQIAQDAYQAGFRGANLVTAIAIALAESTGQSDAHNTKGEDSRGLWQINVAPNAHPQWAGLNLFDPLTNAQKAFDLFTSSGGFGDWSTFTNGAYSQYLPLAQEAAYVIGLDSTVPKPGNSNAFVNAATGQVQQATSALSNPIGSIGSALPQFTVPGLSDIGQAISNLANNIGKGLSSAIDLVNWLDQPNLWLRIGLGLLGGVLILVGLTLFGISLVPKGALPQAIPVPV